MMRSDCLVPLVLAMLVLSNGCSSSGDPEACPEPDTDIVLPDDESPHRNHMEWWYYTGHLWTGDQRRFGFEVSFFQTFANEQVGYVGHFAISDPQAEEHVYAQNMVAPLDVYPDFDLDVGQWNVRGDGTTDYIKADTEGFAVDLALTSTKPTVFHGKRGLIEMGGDMLSFYYSKTRMDVTGTLTVGDTDEPVTGIAWHDHQWGDFDVFASNGWDWFSLQLDDGSEIMIFLLHFKESGTELTGGSFVDPEGCTSHFEQFELTDRDSWVSPHTGADYPLNWNLRIPDHGLDLSIEVIFEDQEVDSRATTLNVYWEGEVVVSGSRDNAPVEGFGYVELAGYGPWGP